MLKGLVEMDTHIIDTICTRDRSGIKSLAHLLARHLHQVVNPELLIVVEEAFYTGSPNVGLLGDTTSRLDRLREAQILGGQGILTLEEYLAHHLDVALGLITGTLTDIDLIVGHQGKAGIGLHLVTLLDGEAIGVGNGAIRSRGTGIIHATGDIHTGCGGSIRGTTCLQDEILDGHIIGIFVSARELYLAMDGEGAPAHGLNAIRDEELILVLKGDVSHHA